MKKLLPAMVAAAAVLFAPAARAEDFPKRPITFISVFGPGSASDTICRVLADPLSTAVKQPVIVENRQGANGAIAGVHVARSAPDGHTMMLATNSPLSAAPFMTKNVGYDAVNDFTPITRVGSFTLIVVVNPSLPIKSIKELVDYAKANPGKLSFASGNTAGIVGGETLKHWAGIDLLHVPYKSTPPALQDVMAGRVSMMFVDLTASLPHVQSGALRPLAVTRLKRSVLYPELPTMDEAGITGFELDAWAGVVAAARTPPAIVARLNSEFGKVIENPEVKKRLVNVGFEAFASSPDEFGDFIKVQFGKWGKMVKDAGIQPE